MVASGEYALLGFNTLHLLVCNSGPLGDAELYKRYAYPYV